jgi:hypothetical protein
LEDIDLFYEKWNPEESLKIKKETLIELFQKNQNLNNSIHSNEIFFLQEEELKIHIDYSLKQLGSNLNVDEVITLWKNVMIVGNPGPSN